MLRIISLSLQDAAIVQGVGAKMKVIVSGLFRVLLVNAILGLSGLLLIGCEVQSVNKRTEASPSQTTQSKGTVKTSSDLTKANKKENPQDKQKSEQDKKEQDKKEQDKSPSEKSKTEEQANTENPGGSPGEGNNSGKGEDTSSDTIEVEEQSAATVSEYNPTEGDKITTTFKHKGWSDDKSEPTSWDSETITERTIIAPYQENLSCGARAQFESFRMDIMCKKQVQTCKPITEEKCLTESSQELEKKTIGEFNDAQGIETTCRKVLTDAQTGKLYLSLTITSSWFHDAVLYENKLIQSEQLSCRVEVADDQEAAAIEDPCNPGSGKIAEKQRVRTEVTNKEKGSGSTVLKVENQAELLVSGEGLPQPENSSVTVNCSYSKGFDVAGMLVGKGTGISLTRTFCDASEQPQTISLNLGTYETLQTKTMSELPPGSPGLSLSEPFASYTPHNDSSCTIDLIADPEQSSLQGTLNCVGELMHFTDATKSSKINRATFTCLVDPQGFE